MLKRDYFRSPLKSRVQLILLEDLWSMSLTHINRLGSLYFQDSDIAGCEPAIVTDGPQDLIGRIESRYCIGPITRKEFWEKQRSAMDYHGPCECFKTDEVRDEDLQLC